MRCARCPPVKPPDRPACSDIHCPAPAEIDPGSTEPSGGRRCRGPRQSFCDPLWVKDTKERSLLASSSDLCLDPPLGAKPSPPSPDPSFSPGRRIARRGGKALNKALNDVFFSEQHVHHIPQHVQQRGVDFLDAMNAEGGDGQAIIRCLFHPAAVLSGETDRQHSDFTGYLQRVIDVG